MSIIQQWETTNKLFIDQYINKNSAMWGEIEYGFKGIVDNKLQNILYNSIVDLSNYNLYIKKTRNDIGSVFSSMIVIRPLKSLIKTCYHICFPISIYYEVYNAIKKERNQIERLRENVCLAANPNYSRIAFTAAGKSIADILRTPVYGVALTIVALLGTGVYLFRIDYLFRTDYLMQLRKLHGIVELSLHWGDKHRCLVKCFVPMENLMKIAKRNKPIEGIKQCSILAFDKMHLHNREYSEKTAQEEPIIYGLTNWAHSQYISQILQDNDRVPDKELYLKLLNYCI